MSRLPPYLHINLVDMVSKELYSFAGTVNIPIEIIEAAQQSIRMSAANEFEKIKSQIRSSQKNYPKETIFESNVLIRRLLVRELGLVSYTPHEDPKSGRNYVCYQNLYSGLMHNGIVVPYVLVDGLTEYTDDNYHYYLTPDGFFESQKINDNVRYRHYSPTDKVPVFA